VVNGCLGWDGDLKSVRNRAVWMTVLLVGLLFSIVGGSPIQVIRFAQVANGVLLPLIVAFLLWAVNKRNLLGNFVNSNTQNLLGVIVLLFVTLLSVRTLWLIT
jgi:Mn2+/Fe2+ NRAMP family transporter